LKKTKATSGEIVLTFRAHRGNKEDVAREKTENSFGHRGRGDKNVNTVYCQTPTNQATNDPTQRENFTKNKDQKHL